MITDLGHLAIRCYDLDKSLEFYARLGIKEAFRLDRDDGSLMLVYCHISGDRFLELFPNGLEPGEPQLPPQTGSFFHLCLVTDDIASDVAMLKENGVEIVREIKQGKDSNLQAWLFDPDNNPIELMQLSEESPQYKIAHSEA